jgi:hypothetical protein
MGISVKWADPTQDVIESARPADQLGHLAEVKGSAGLRSHAGGGAIRITSIIVTPIEIVAIAGPNPYLPGRRNADPHAWWLPPDLVYIAIVVEHIHNVGGVRVVHNPTVA